MKWLHFLEVENFKRYGDIQMQALILDGKPEALPDRQEIRDALKHYGAEHYVKARETGHVLYVEGSTDVDM